MPDWAEIIKALCFWGPGAVIAGLMILALYKLAKNIGLEFVSAQRSQAEALGKQAQSMEGLRESIQGYIVRESKEHREIVILQKVILDRIENLEGMRNGSQERTISAHQRRDAEAARLRASGTD